MEGIGEDGVKQLLDHELSRSGRAVSFKDIFPPFEMPEPNMEDDDCGDHEFRGDYHSPNPLTAEGFDKAFKQTSGIVELSEGAVANQDAFVDLAERCDGIKGVLTSNGNKREATVKHLLEETSMAITAMVLKK